MNKSFIKNFLAKIKEAKNILIIGHKNPDADSLGSVLGLARLLRENLNKKVNCSYEGAMADFLDFMPGRDDILYAEKIEFAGKYDLLIVLDAPLLRMLGALSEEIFHVIGDSIAIDHHVVPSNEDGNFAELNFMDSGYSSTAEIIYKLADANAWQIDADAATCLYAGLVADSGKFDYTQNGDTLRVAGALVDAGADPRRIALALDAQTKKDILTEALAVARAEFFYHDKLAVATITREMYRNLNGKANVVMQVLRQIDSVEYVVVLKEAKENMIRVSMRGKTRPVREIAERFGGGGHDFAAAANMKIPLDAAKKLLISEFKNV